MNGAPYYRFSRYLRERFGCRVHKVTVDAGFTCPNRDGTLASGGCIYCNNEGFSPNTRRPHAPVPRQIEDGIAALRRKTGAGKFLVYFQAYTNTYAPLPVLRETFDAVRSFPDVAGIAVSTRPDCVDGEVLDLLRSYTDDLEVWVEYGLQSVHDATLAAIHRGHTFRDFVRAVELTRRHPEIKICAHVIIGLPGEDEGMILRTAEEIAALRLEGVKLHPLHVMKGTHLETMYRKGSLPLMERGQYVQTAARFLERLPPDTVIQRLTADCPADILVAPAWLSDKNGILLDIEAALVRSGSRQGKLFAV